MIYLPHGGGGLEKGEDWGKYKRKKEGKRQTKWKWKVKVQIMHKRREKRIKA
jgi:hypothetical protein